MLNQITPIYPFKQPNISHFCSLFVSHPHELQVIVLSLLFLWCILSNSWWVLLIFGNNCFRCAGIACQSAEIVGLASLVSLEMNELVALDEGIVKGLILMLGSGKRKVSVAACNAVLDLSSTLIGRRSLLEFSALEWFM